MGSLTTLLVGAAVKDLTAPGFHGPEAKRRRAHLGTASVALADAPRRRLVGNTACGRGGAVPDGVRLGGACSSGGPHAEMLEQFLFGVQRLVPDDAAVLQRPRRAR